MLFFTVILAFRVFRLDLVAQLCHDRRPSLGLPPCPPAIRPLVSTGRVTYDVKRVVEIGLLHTNGDPDGYKRALCAMKTCSRKQFAPGFTLVPALRGRLRAFTLVEMLVVLGMIVILLSAVMPVVTSLSKANGRKAAMANLLGGIEQARAEAINTSQATYVVFPTFGAGTTQSTLDRYNYKSYAIFEDNAANPGSVKQVTPWKALATGVALRAAGTAALANLAPTASPTPSPPTPTFTFTPDTSATPVYQYLKFNSNGEVEAPAA